MVKNKICSILNLTKDSTSLRPLTNHRPIASLPFAGRYRVIDFTLSSLAYAGIESVGIFIGDSGRSLYDHIRSGAAWDLSSAITGGVFTFSQQNWKKRHHLEDPDEDFYFNHELYITRSKTDYIFVAGSRIIANIDIQAVTRSHINNGKDVTVLYKTIQQDMAGPEDRMEYAIIDVEEDTELVKFSEVADQSKVNASLNMYVLTVDKMMDLINRAREEEVYEELDDLIQHYIHDLSINSYEYTGYAASMDSIETYYAANMEMLDRAKFTALFHSSIPIRTKSKDGSPTYYDVDSYVRRSIVGTDCDLYGELTDSIINRRVFVDREAKVQHSIILQGSHIGEGAVVEYAIIDKNTTVAPGARLIGKPDDILVVAKNSYIEA